MSRKVSPLPRKMSFTLRISIKQLVDKTSLPTLGVKPTMRVRGMLPKQMKTSTVLVSQQTMQPFSS
jgi:hypothetical protein